MTSELIEKSKPELAELRLEYQRLRETYRKILPKVDPELIDDLLSREQQQEKEDPDTRPMYTVEVFTKGGVDTETARWYIFDKTGMMPAIYDHGTHFVTDQRLTLETLKEISDSDDVIEVTGEYSGSFASNGATHERHLTRQDLL